MPRWQLRYLISCAAIIGWCAAYTLAAWGEWTVLIYDPLDRSWWWDDTTGGPVPINYFGFVLWGLGGATVGGALAAIVARLWRRALPDVALRMLGAWAVTAFLLAGTYFLWTLWPF